MLGVGAPDQKSAGEGAPGEEAWEKLSSAWRIYGGRARRLAGRVSLLCGCDLWRLEFRNRGCVVWIAYILDRSEEYSAGLLVAV